MVTFSPPGPAVLYLDLDGLDTAPAEALFGKAGLDVLHAADVPDPEALTRVVALMVGYDDVGDTWFERLPGLRIVATHSAGYDMVDLAAARRRDLWVANLPGAATDEVAVHTLAMLLSLVRRLPVLDREVRAGRWDTSLGDGLPRLPADLTCGVIGLGRIGRRFAELAAPLFGAVVGYDPHLPESAWPSSVRRLDLADLLTRSDCVSLHLPLTEASRGLIDADALASMAPGGVLVNVSRGELVDHRALVASLRSGHLAAAACDVLAHEPPRPDEDILHDDRVLLSPHVAYLSPGSLQRYAEVPARNVLALLEDGTPLHPVLRPAAP